MNVFGRRSEDRPPRRMRKGMYLLPSLFTTANLAAGYYAISHTVLGSASERSHFDHAAIAIGFAVLFDGIDGAIARLTGTTSDFGRELDSLADVVTFGVAPALLAWMWGSRSLAPTSDPALRFWVLQLGAIISFIFLAAGAARLARFNITLNPQPANPGRPGRKYFVGMPIPGGAACVAVMVHLVRGTPIETWWVAALWFAGIGLLAFLMVSRWRFWSAKNLDFHNRQPFWIVLVLCVIIALVWNFSRIVLFAFAALYMLSGVWSRLHYALRRRTAMPPASHQQEVTGH
jgi:CDP-diacylglycerol--serine O-phosphatidyltransferase